jgi:hypothetical protein
MPGLRTEITEIATAAEMLGYGDIAQALSARPGELVDVLT